MKMAVIPARGGSKRIPKKNIKLFYGKPMIAWSIEAAKKSELFEKIIVSTDDESIAEVAIKYGAEVPFLRPAELSDDFVGTIPVIAHAINWYIDAGYTLSEICCIYATAPFLQPCDLVQGLEILRNSKAAYAFSVTKYAFPIQRAIGITEDHRVNMFQPEYFNSRSQDLDEAWHDAAQFYWGTFDAWLTFKSFFGPHAAPVILPRHRVQDIDVPEDWDRAELMFKVVSSNQS